MMMRKRERSGPTNEYFPRCKKERREREICLISGGIKIKVCWLVQIFKLIFVDVDVNSYTAVDFVGFQNILPVLSSVHLFFLIFFALL